MEGKEGKERKGKVKAERWIEDDTKRKRWNVHVICWKRNNNDANYWDFLMTRELKWAERGSIPVFLPFSGRGGAGLYTWEYT